MEPFKKPNNNESPGLNWSFRDFFISLSVIFFAMAILAFVVTKSNDVGKKAGPLIISMHWENTSNSDIDLWVKSPGNDPVGYSRPNDINCDHLRDDTGMAHDPESNNSEETVCRKATEGEWAVDVMAYSVSDGVFPIWVNVSVQEIKPTGLVTLLQKRVVFSSIGEEITVWRFSLNHSGDLIFSSLNTLVLQMGPIPTSLIGSNSPEAQPK